MEVLLSVTSCSSSFVIFVLITLVLLKIASYDQNAVVSIEVFAQNQLADQEVICFSYMHVYYSELPHSAISWTCSTIMVPIWACSNKYINILVTK